MNARRSEAITTAVTGTSPAPGPSRASSRLAAWGALPSIQPHRPAHVAPKCAVSAPLTPGERGRTLGVLVSFDAKFGPMDGGCRPSRTPPGLGQDESRPAGFGCPSSPIHISLPSPSRRAGGGPAGPHRVRHGYQPGGQVTDLLRDSHRMVAEALVIAADQSRVHGPLHAV